MLSTAGYAIPQLWIVNIVQEMWYLLFQIIHYRFSIGLLYRMKVRLEVSAWWMCHGPYTIDRFWSMFFTFGTFRYQFDQKGVQLLYQTTHTFSLFFQILLYQHGYYVKF
jgi:hypothetical protein